MAAKKTGPSTLRGSKRARQITVAVLEALSGEVGTTEAADKLGISLSRYYQLEARALAGMLEALEPRGRGPQKTPEREIKALGAEKRALEKELRRQQALLRAAQRSVGLPTRGTKGSSSKKRGRTKRGSRGRTVLQTLRQAPGAREGGTDGTAERDGDAGERGRSESSRA
jgi:hypothetical protein